MSYRSAFDAAYAAGQRQTEDFYAAQQRGQDRRVGQAMSSGDYGQAANILGQMGRPGEVMKVQQYQAQQAGQKQEQAKGFLLNAANALLQVPEAETQARYMSEVRPVLQQMGAPEDLLRQMDTADKSHAALKTFAATLGGKAPEREKLEIRQAGRDVFALDPYTGAEVARHTGTADPLDTEYKEARIASLEGKTEAADAKQAEKQERLAAAQSARQFKAEAIVGAIDDVLGNVGKGPGGFSGEAGWVGERMSQVPGTKAYDVRESLETIKANLGFEELAAMRAASPTGGALGAIAVQELKALQATVANLDIGQSREQLVRELTKIKTHYTRWLEAVRKDTEQQAAPQAPASGGGGYSKKDLEAEARRRGLIR